MPFGGTTSEVTTVMHNWKTRSLGALVGFLGAFGGMGVMVTGLRFSDAFGMGPVAIWCLIFSLLAAVLAGRKGAFLLPLALGLLTLWGWKGLNLNRSLEALLYFVSQLYRSGYGWPLIRWSDDPLTYGNALRAFCFLGAWLSMAVTFGYLNRGGVWLGAFAAALPLLPCLVLTDTVPEAKWLFLQLFSLLLLLFCSKNPKRGFYVTLPIALALGGLFLLMPKETYKGQDTAERIWNWLEAKLTQTEPEGPVDVPVWAPDLQGQQVDLSSAGPRPRWMVPTMYITAPGNDTLYLRAAAFDRYTGSRWQMDPNEGQFPRFTTPGQQLCLTVKTLSVHDTLYLPYGAESAYFGPQILEDRVTGRVDNPLKVTEYDVFYKPTDWCQVSQAENSMSVLSVIPGQGGDLVLGQDGVFLHTDTTVWSRYLELPDETRRRAEAWLNAHLPAAGNSKWETAQIICRLVSQSAAYELSTGRMPRGEDFAMWFLEESETGYCVHFASAAAVLLRAAGIPSRYVSGFLVTAGNGEAVTVYQKNAHAWVEVYIEGAGWVLLEPTPGDGVEDTLSETVPSVDATAPTESGETTAPTEPIESTAGGDPTLPSQTTPIGGADKPQNPGTSTQKKPLPQWVKGLLWILAGFAGIIAQWQLRLRLRKLRRHKGNLNRQVLTLWREAVLCGKALGQKPPENLFQLAQKAKFSQHAITPQERAQAAAYLEAMRKQLKDAPLWHKVIAFLLALR